MKKQIALAIVLALSAGTVALAETAEEQQACTNDAFALCQNYIPDRNRVFTCLVDNRNQLSVPCHTVMLQYLPPEPVVALKKPAARPRQRQPPRAPRAKVRSVWRPTRGVGSAEPIWRWRSGGLECAARRRRDCQRLACGASSHRHRARAP